MATASIGTSRSRIEIAMPNRTRNAASDLHHPMPGAGIEPRGLGIDHDFPRENPGANHLAHSRPRLLVQQTADRAHFRFLLAIEIFEQCSVPAP